MSATRPGSMRTRLVLAAAIGCLLLAAALAELLPLVPSIVPAAPDYASDAAWICRPGRADVCATPVTATAFAPDGIKTIVTYTPDPAAPIDCFYVYPTVSRAPYDNAPIAVTAEESGVARRQLARFATVCRPYAPLYRQVTRKGLRKTIADPNPDLPLHKIAAADVRAAWHRYLAQDNKGRGFVLIGHSQGSKILARLMAEEIDGTPLERQLVAAILPGTKVDVPPDAPVGGSFRHIPLCTSADAPGCVIAYSTYPAARPMPADARMGVTTTPGMIDACVDPAALAGAPTLDAALPVGSQYKDRLGTDFAELPGLITATCVRDGRFSYLAVATNAKDPAGEKARDKIERIGEYSPAWGLHALDLNLAEGTLVDIVRRQAAAYAKRRGAPAP